MRALLFGLLLLAQGGVTFAQTAGGGTPVTAAPTSTTTSAAPSVCANSVFSAPTLVDNSFNATNVAAGSLTLCSLAGFAAVQSPIWLKIYDETTTPNPTTDTPKLVLFISPQEALPQIAPVQFNSGLGFAITWGTVNVNATMTTGNSPINGFVLGYRQ